MTKTQKTLSGAVLLPVFIPTVVVMLLLIIGTLSNPELAESAFQSALAWVTKTFGWSRIAVVSKFAQLFKVRLKP